MAITNRPVVVACRLLIAFEVGGEAVVDDVVRPARVDRARGEGGVGAQAVRKSICAVRATFADRRLVIKELFAPDDRIVARVHVSAARVGECFGIAPAGRRVDGERIHIWRGADRRLVEHWVVCDHLLETLRPPAIRETSATAVGASRTR